MAAALASLAAAASAVREVARSVRPNKVLQSDGRPGRRFDKARPRPNVGCWMARPLSATRRPPLNTMPLCRTPPLMTKLVFLDLNGTLVSPVLVERLDDFRILPGVPAALAKLAQAGFLCPVVTVQSRIAKGFFTEAEFGCWFQDLAAQMKQAGARLEGPYVCPHRYRDPCACKKPNTTLYDRAARDLALPLPGAFVIGDTADDMEAARRIGGFGCLIRPDAGELPTAGRHAASFEGRDVPEAVAWILSRAAA